MTPGADPVSGSTTAENPASENMLGESELRRLLQEVVDGLALRPPWDLQALCDRLSEQRGRPIVLVPRKDLPVNGGFGCLVRYPDKDLIVFQQRSTGPGRAWIVFHELTHLIRGHQASAGATPLQCGAVGIGGQSGTLYDSWQEWEAETGAAILSECAGRPWCGPVVDAGADDERSVARGFGRVGNRR